MPNLTQYQIAPPPVKKDYDALMGSASLNTSNKTIKGAINEVNTNWSSMKTISGFYTGSIVQLTANKKLTKSNIDISKYLYASFYVSTNSSFSTDRAIIFIPLYQIDTGAWYPVNINGTVGAIQISSSSPYDHFIFNITGFSALYIWRIYLFQKFK